MSSRDLRNMELAQGPRHWFRTIFLCAIALSIGWGIRGNFGHEYGAGFAGCLGTLTACLMSGREDWRRRLPYFAMFGAFGWGFGGSISYMQVISYTHSGHGPSVLYGFVGLFWIGFLWAALGVAGAALAAAAERDLLTRMFRPFLFVVGAWIVFPPMIEALERALDSGADETLFRQKSPLYWFDADYIPAFVALIGLCAFDVWDRAERNAKWLPVCVAGGALGGWLVQLLLGAVGLAGPIARAITWSLGDPNAIDAATGEPYGAEALLNNWPQWVTDHPGHVGWVVGAIGGTKMYFLRWGKFRDGASLFVHMASGWLVCFMLVPVLGSLFFTEYGGLRMTPPRSDDWAGITGVFIGATVWALRTGHGAVAFASVVGGTIGGIGFAGAAWLKLATMRPGNRGVLEAMVADGTLAPEEAARRIERWADWQSQNWHSFLEQSYGAVNGVAVAVALLLLARRVPARPDPDPSRRWTLGVAAFFGLIGVTYVNLVKNVSDWTFGFGGNWVREIADGAGGVEKVPASWDVPYLGRLPGVDLALTPLGWFNLTYLLIAVAFAVLVRAHLKRPIAAIPRSALGRGQIFFLALLWTMVVGNWERAMPGWHPSRLLTEWAIFANAVLATVLVLLWPREGEGAEPAIAETTRWWPRWAAAWIVGGLIATAAIAGMYRSTRALYGDRHAGHSMRQTRFGPDAEWKVRPILKHRKHS